jgi:hypothetical protein
LEGAEESYGAGNGATDEPELSDGAGPDFGANALTPLQPLKELGELKLAVRWEFEGLSHRIHDPPEQLLASGPAPIPFGKLLEGDSFESVFARGRPVKD